MVEARDTKHLKSELMQQIEPSDPEMQSMVALSQEVLTGRPAEVSTML